MINSSRQRFSSQQHQPHTIKLEQNLGEPDTKMAAERIESYNKEVRDRHMKTFKKRQEKRA